MKAKFKSVKDYVNHFSKLIEIERKEEIKFHKNEIVNLTAKEREMRGRALTSMRAYYEGTMLMKHVFSFKKADGSTLPENEIKVGDVVLVSDKAPLRRGKIGTVIEKGRRRIRVAFDNILPVSWKKQLLRVDLFCNDTTFQRMHEALKMIEEGVSLFPTSVLLGMNSARIKRVELNGIKFFNKKLNESQRRAVALALSTKPVFMIHGPPGTGKTVTCVEIIKQLVLEGKRVLVCADSNTAVDNIAEKLAGKVKLVRVGHPARVSKKIFEHFLDFMIECSIEKSEIDELFERIEELRKKRDVLVKPSPKLKRGLSDEQILKLARKRKSARGISSKDMMEMALWITYNKSIKALIKKRERLLHNLAKKIIKEAQVVCTTNAGSFSDVLKDEIFDVVVIDEATQATEPSCLMPIVKAPYVIMAGDHKQLPPTVLSKTAEKKGLAFTLFERFMNLYGKKASTMLEYQYRMNPLLMRFSSMKFYNNKLKADESVTTITIRDIIRRKIRDKSLIEHATLDENPLVFIDTAGFSRERRRADSTSLENIEEAKVVKDIITCLVNADVNINHIGVISPYKDQMELLKNTLKGYDVEVNTVDGFQGREKDIIIISLVRSNLEREIGFLKDKRRLNVAITRAKRKLIIVGDSKTLTKHKLYRELIDHIKTNGIYVKLEC